jgi:hypothetical protein
MNLFGRSIAAVAMGLALSTAPALAQIPDVPPPIEGQEKGDPVVPYVVVAFLCAFAIFVVCKSARR